MFFPMTPRSRHSGSPLCYALAVILCCVLLSVVQSAEATLRHAEHQRSAKSVRLPNVLIFIVDDLGWNQVGYHAAPAGNEEIQTPHIDAAVAGGIELNRGYVTPWFVHALAKSAN